MKGLVAHPLPTVHISYSTDPRQHPPPAWLLRTTLTCAILPLVASTIWILIFWKFTTPFLARIGTTLLPLGLLIVAGGAVADFRFFVRAHAYAVGRHHYCGIARRMLYLLYFDIAALLIYSVLCVEMLVSPLFIFQVSNDLGRDVRCVSLVSGSARVSIPRVRRGPGVFPVELCLQGGPLHLVIDERIVLDDYVILNYADSDSLDPRIVHEIRLIKGGVQLQPAVSTADTHPPGAETFTAFEE